MDAIAGTVEVRYGRIEWLIINGLCLLFVITFFLCLANYVERDSDFNRDKPNNEPTVTATPGYISVSTETIDNTNKHLVISNSSISVDATVQAKDGRVLFTSWGLLPGSSFCFKSEEPLTITASAS